jgi:DNA helicase HerA-like ATPase
VKYLRKDVTNLQRQEMFTEKHDIFLGYGLDLIRSFSETTPTNEEAEIWLNPKERAGHTLVVGTTGSGKTVLLSNLSKSDILTGHRIIYVDPKGDTDLFKNFVSYAKVAGRFNPETFMFLSPMYLDYSIEMNPLWGLDPDEAAVVLVSAIPDGKEPFFKKVAFMVLLAIMLSLKSNNRDDWYPSILEVAEYFSLDRLKHLRDEIEEIIREVAAAKDPKFQRYSADAALVLDHLTVMDSSYFEKITTTLKAEIDIITTGAIGQVIGRAKTNRLVENLINDQDVIFLAYLGALRYGDEIVGRAARMIFSSVQRLAGKMYQHFQKFNPPLAIYGDEAKNLFYDGIEDLFNKVRGANIFMTFATQSLGDIVAALGPDKMQSIVGNTNIQIFMRATDKYTMEYVESTSDEVYIYRPNFIQHSLGVTQQRQRSILGPYLKQLKTGSFYASVYGQWYRLYTPFEPTPTVIDFEPEKVFFDTSLGSKKEPPTEP